MVVGAPGVGAFVVALTSDALPAFVPVRSWAYGPCMGLGEPLFLGVNFVNFPDVWNLRFCSVRRVNLGQVSGGVASPSVAPMQDKKDLGALGTGRGVFSPKRRH